MGNFSEKLRNDVVLPAFNKLNGTLRTSCGVASQASMSQRYIFTLFEFIHTMCYQERKNLSVVLPSSVSLDVADDDDLLDNMESFFISETLVYLYLIAMDNTIINQRVSKAFYYLNIILLCNGL